MIFQFTDIEGATHSPDSSPELLNDWLGFENIFWSRLFTQDEFSNAYEASKPLFKSAVNKARKYCENPYDCNYTDAQLEEIKAVCIEADLAFRDALEKAQDKIYNEEKEGNGGMSM